MKKLFVIPVVVSVICFGISAGIAAEMPRDPLDRLWEEHMLRGEVAEYIDGQKTEYSVKEESVSEKARGSVASPIRVITVADLRGTSYFGLLRGGGWTLMGGLIARVEGKNAALELYGKRVWREYPGLLGMWNTFRPKEEETYDFFLLQRQKGASHATILKKWTIQPSEIHWFIPKHTQESKVISEKVKQQNATRDVRGFLKYLPKSQEAEVTVTGLTHPFVERVKVSLK